MRRRELLASTLLLAATACAPASGAAQAARSRSGPGPTLRGADLSFTLELEAAGYTFTDEGRSGPLEQLLAERGANVVRLRAWVNPDGGHSDLRSALALGRRAKDAGCTILLALHYSDSWADHSNQDTPGAWRGQDATALAATVQGYTRDVVRAFAAQGTSPQIVQIGNEVTNGMLWPVGQVAHSTGPGGWEVFGELLKAGVRGAREAATAPLETMIHIDRGGDHGGSRYFYDHILRSGVEFDLIGLSYYPFWHGSLETLGANLHELAGRYEKDVVVVETAYPWMFPAGGDVEYFASGPDELPDGDRFPATPAGQAAYFEALRGVVDAVPAGRGRGFLAWEPAWLPGVGWDHGEINPYANLTMFDWDGTGLPSLAAFRA